MEKNSRRLETEACGFLNENKLMSEQSIVVISNRDQLRMWKDACAAPAKCVLYSDNHSFFDELNEEMLLYNPIDEFTVQPQWEALNTWGCEASLSLLEQSRDNGCFKDFDLPSVLNHDFSRMLAQIVKNFEYANFILDKHDPCDLYVFSNAKVNSYPKISGNFYLNYFLNVIGHERSFNVLPLHLNHEKTRVVLEDYSSPWQRLRGFIASRLKNILRQLAGAQLNGPIGSETIVAFGPLKHIGDVVGKLIDSGESVALYDFDFHKDQYRYAQQRKIPYLLPSKADDRFGRNDHTWVDVQIKELTDVLKLPQMKHCFIYKGRDLSSFITENIISSMGEYLTDLSTRVNNYRDLLDKVRPKALLLHEDFSTRGGPLAALAKSRNIKVFCISHANLSVNFSVRKERRVFSNSETLVTSEFEKDNYASRGWDESHLTVTGRPQYDRLYSIGPRPRECHPKPLKLLYCATGLWPHGPNQRGYLGVHFSCFKQTQLPAFNAILDAIRGHPIELQIKPHSDAGEAIWKHHLSRNSASNQVKILDYRSDIFRLYHESDAMILSYWSSAIIEAAIMDLPMLLVDFNRAYAGQIEPLIEAGLIAVAKEPKSISSEISELMSCGKFSSNATNVKSTRSYFLGPDSGKAAVTICRHIIQTLGGADKDRRMSDKKKEGKACFQLDAYESTKIRHSRKFGKEPYFY